MTLVEKQFWRLLAELTSEGKVLGDAGERLAAGFEAVVTALEQDAYWRGRHDGDCRARARIAASPVAPSAADLAGLTIKSDWDADMKKPPP